ncbi:hypothetical protein PsW64_01876 [Pseudovibrio sp. W64]|nr:hypothetical protein PsW64_01876 [Pseudovibrio sp. W64]
MPERAGSTSALLYLERVPEKWFRFSDKNTRKIKELELGA